MSLSFQDTFDINSVCTINENLIASGADDGLIKLWDKRIFDKNARPVGGFIGHHEGIISMDSTFQHD
jgi:hypothetical protein